MRPTDLLDLPPDAIVVHGGMHKTGSSAIQNTLQANRGALAEAGWLYPRAGLVDQVATGHRHRTLMTEVRDNILHPSWRQLHAELDGWHGRVLISHENFFSPQIDPLAVAALMPDRPVYLLAYLRHPVDYVESCYREWVRRWKYRHGIRTFYESRRDYLDVEALRDAWEATFGADRVLLRPYERDRLVGGTVLSDFVATLGLDAPLAPVPGLANESLSTSQTLVHLVANRVAARASRRDEISASLDRPLQPRRIADDGLVDELTDRHLGAFRDVLREHGAAPGSLADSAFADLPADTLFTDPAVPHLVAELLAD